MKGKLLALGLFVLTCMACPAQALPPLECGTRLSPADTNWLYQLPWYGNNAYLFDLLRELDASSKTNTMQALCGGVSPAQFRIPLQAVLVRRSDSMGITSDHLPDSVLREVNRLYALNGTGIQFYWLCEPRYIYNDYYYAQLGDSSTQSPLFAQIDTDGAIDVFFVGAFGQEFFGSARFPAWTHPFHALVRCNRASLNDVAETLAHEFAHCFNVLHTADGTRCEQFDNAFCPDCTQEAVSRSKTQGLFCSPFGQLKCELNGDFLCDTEADGGSYSGNAIDGANVVNCVRISHANNNYNKDNWGDAWAPDLSNLMTYAHGCRSTFTPMQKAVMVATILNYIPFYYLRAENSFDTFEPDNHPLSALPLPLGDVQCHTFHWSPLSPLEFSACDVDWMAVELPAFGALEVKTFAVAGQPQPDTYLELFDTALTLIASNDSLLPGSQFAWIPDINLPAGRYLIRASHRSPQGSAASRGHYHIQANYGPPVSAPAAERPDLLAALRFDDVARQLVVTPGRSGRYALVVQDLQGRQVGVEEFGGAAGVPHRVEMAGLATGVYVVGLRCGGLVMRERILIGMP